jgi:hypothetical protein
MIVLIGPKTKCQMIWVMCKENDPSCISLFVVVNVGKLVVIDVNTRRSPEAPKYPRSNG